MKKVISILGVVFTAIILTACGSEPVSKIAVPAYRVSNTSEYAAAPDKGVGYRVVVITPITDEELTAIFKEVTLNDGYPVHTMWFYKSEQEVIQGAYTVAMLEQKSKGAEPEIARLNSTDTIEETQETIQVQNITTEAQTEYTEPSSTSTANNTTTKAIVSNTGRMIYITPTGKKYHYDSSCNGGTYTESNLEKAKQRGLTPCEKCVS